MGTDLVQIRRAGLGLQLRGTWGDQRNEIEDQSTYEQKLYFQIARHLQQLKGWFDFWRCREQDEVYYYRENVLFSFWFRSYFGGINWRLVGGIWGEIDSNSSFCKHIFWEENIYMLGEIQNFCVVRSKFKAYF